MQTGTLGGLVKIASAAFDVVRPPREGLVILIYHRVGGHTPVSVDLPRGLFDEQIAYLAERYHPLTLDEAADHLARGTPPSSKPAVVVTFDDGTVDFAEEAVPVLVEHAVPATLYVATDHLERELPFRGEGRPVSWNALADAVATGLITIGSHTHTHRLLDRVDGPGTADELDRSIGLIGDRLGLQCHHFAYPKAVLGSVEAQREVTRRFQTAAVAGGRANPWQGTRLHRLARTPIQTTDGLRWFRRKAVGGLRLENDMREWLNRRRYANLTS